MQGICDRCLENKEVFPVNEVDVVLCASCWRDDPATVAEEVGTNKGLAKQEIVNLHHGIIMGLGGAS